MMGDGRETPILAAKLYPATGTRRPLPRSRLDSLSEVLDGAYPVTLLDAPAGYGKSTLMARWHAQLVERDVPCAWLSVDEHDDDKVRFMRHLLAALRENSAPTSQSVSEDLSAGSPDGTTSLLELLAGELARTPQRLVLFLDDLHLVEEPEVLEIVDWLVNYAPRNVQQIIGTRERRHLRLSGLRLRGELFELNLRQLRFDTAEASLFYRSRLGRDLSAQELQRVVNKTEGWPAALELVALALAGLAEPSAFIEHFSGTDSSVVEYLGEAVASRMDEKTRGFVYRISMFDRISAPLAKAVGDIDDAEELLETLRSGNLFLIPLDQSAIWVRFHHLVGEFFRERYQRTANSRARECLVRGAHWLHAGGYIEEAVNCLIRAQEWEQAARWVADSLEELVFRRGYHQTILRWMNALPETYVDRHPIIRIQYAFALAFQPRRREYEAQIHRLQELLQNLEAQPDRVREIDELRCAVELLTAMSTGLRDEGELGGQLAAQWLARWPDESLRRKGVMGNVLAFGHKTRGEIEQGLRVIGETRRWLEQAEGFYALAWTAFLDAVLYLKRGSYSEARIACNSGLELVERELRGHLPQASMLHALLAGIAYEFDEIGPTVEHTERAMSGVNDGHADAVIIAYLTQARLQRLRHDEESAIAILRQGQEIGERRGLKRVTLSLAAEECTGLARAGRCDEARLTAARFGFDELHARGGKSALAADKALRAASRYLLLQAPKPVIQALDTAIEYCRGQDLAHRSVELLLIRAIAHRQAGNQASASNDLEAALTIAAPRGYLRLFLDEGRALAVLVQSLDLERLHGSQAAPLARRLQQTMGKADLPHTSSLSEGLTRREISILKRLETGLSNKEIAEAIFVSEGTLKWHLHNVYSKLNVKNRTGAMTRARVLGIL
jgi:ATP/maltotriose-dependent transcriptional regulator MalT